LWWWAKFAASGADRPGTAKEGGTSAWVLVNSLSATETGNPNYRWRGWNGDIANHNAAVPWAVVPTWRNGAEGAYSFTHDDIGAMPFDRAVLPGWRVARDFPDIKQGWGVFVREMSESDWEQARQMVLQGHEMFNHSMDHTSAANRFFIFNPGDIIPQDPDIPQELRGLEVVGAWTINWHHHDNGWRAQDYDHVASGNHTGGVGVGQANIGVALSDRNGGWQGPLRKPYYEDGSWIDTLRATNELITIYAYPYWEGASPNPDARFADGRSTIMKIEPKPGTQEFTLPTGQVVYIRDGKISVSSTGWFEEIDIINRWPFYYNRADLGPSPSSPGAIACVADGRRAYTACDRGRPGFILALHTAFGWDETAFNRNIDEANAVINREIYEKIGATPYFKAGKRSEYFGYPFDVFSEVTHARLEQSNFVGARGGAKSGVPMAGDFFHPYRIDFDAFFIERRDWTPNSKGAGFVYPDNAHVLLGLNEMVDEIIRTRGYMIREFHAVADIQSPNAWYDDNPNPDQWPVNNPGANVGGWWGGIAEFQLRQHYEYLQQRIDARQIVVYTPSEAIKYRTTANAVTGATIVGNQNTYTLTVQAAPIAEKYQDEISVIVAFRSGTDRMSVRYADGESAYRRPIPMNAEGTRWSVNVNPYKGPATITPGAEWGGPTSISGGRNLVTRQASVSFAGIGNGQINLNLQSGNYTAQLFNVQGRMIGSANFNAVNGVNATGIRTDNLARGLVILQVRNAEGASVLQHRFMLR
jgi:hypothetical protein